MKTPKPTYTQGRKCLKCGAPISDQTHQNREHCPRTVLPDGSIESCKDDRNAQLRKEKDDPYRKPTVLQKKLTQALDSILKAKAATVTVEDLDRYEINLRDAVHKTPKGSKLFNFAFTCHRLEQLSLTYFKIHPHAHAL